MALIYVEQIDVIVDLMSPEIQVSGSGSSCNSGNSATAVKTTTDAVPAQIPPDVPRQPGFDWRAIMRKNFSVLTQKLDPDNGLFEELRSREVISDWNIDIFKVCVSCSLYKLHG